MLWQIFTYQKNMLKRMDKYGRVDIINEKAEQIRRKDY